MTDPGWALQKAVYAKLITNADVLAALGGPQVFDHVPRRTSPPYITFAPSEVLDWSTSSSVAHEHVLRLHIWTKATGRKQASAVAVATRSALHDQALSLEGHMLINLRHIRTEIQRSPDGEQLLGIVRFRAVTETA